MRKITWCLLIWLVLVFPSLQAYGQDNRIITATVISDRNRGEIERLLESCNEELSKQIGVTIQIIEYRSGTEISQTNHFFERLNTLYKLPDIISDIVINFDFYTPQDMMAKSLSKLMTAYICDGYVDNEYRRFMVIKNLDKRTFLHEFYHFFILSHNHSNKGIMKSITNNIKTLELSEEDKAEILSNKWRVFGVKVSINSKDLTK